MYIRIHVTYSYYCVILMREFFSKIFEKNIEDKMVYENSTSGSRGVILRGI